MVELLLLAYSVSFHVLGCNDGLSANVVFDFNQGKLEIGGLEEIKVFGSLSDWGSGKSVLVPKYKVKRMKRRKYLRRLPFRGLGSFLMIWFFHFK